MKKNKNLIVAPLSEDQRIKSNIQFIHELCKKRYPGAATVFWGGSTSCHQETTTSDLDIVIIFHHLPQAYREAFVNDGRLIDAFIHDKETLNYFFEKIDAPSYMPALPNMIYTGIEIPSETSLGKTIKNLAQDLLKKGPEISKSMLDYRRFLITDLLDDLKGTSDKYEFLSISSSLHKNLCEFYLLSHHQWIGEGKMLIKMLRDFNPEICDHIYQQYQAAITKFQYEPMEKVTQKLLKSYGGLLWDGFRLDAPKKWRKNAR